MRSRLYHYLGANYALQDLQLRRLKIATFQDLNDPFELIAADNSDRKQRQFLRGWKEDIQSKWGVLCFSRTWRNPVLWSHYADKHKGMCLGFDISNELLLPIKYSQSRISVDLVTLQNSGGITQKFMLRLMGTKFSGWSYENEVRVSSELKERDPDTGLLFVQFSDDLILRKVIAGPLCDVRETEIRDALGADHSHIKPKKARLAFQKFNVVENKKGSGSLQ